MLDRAPILYDTSIRDFQQGKAGYVANVVEQALLLPADMAVLRSMRKHEVFLSLKRDLAMVSLLTSFLIFKIITIFHNHYISFIGRLFKLHIRPKRWQTTPTGR